CRPRLTARASHDQPAPGPIARVDMPVASIIEWRAPRSGHATASPAATLPRPAVAPAPGRRGLAPALRAPADPCNPVGRRGGAAPWRPGAMKIRQARTGSAIALVCAAGLIAAATHAQTLESNATGIHDGYYYTFWKDSGPASMTLHPGGRYGSQWTSGTNNWVGGKGWNPGGPRVVNYSGHYGVDSSQNSYLALYGWTRDPLIEYYVIESYGSYSPASCAGGMDYGSFQSDGATYSV